LIQLVDTSVLILRERNAQVAEWFRAQLLADALAVCEMISMEYLFGARNGQHYDELREALGAMRQVPIEPADWRRASEVQRTLAHQTGGGQRAVKIPDLVIAAAAERAQLPLIHYDEDYERISAITGQPASWVAPRGTV
jgi:predicted nucleic acid-binding protein